MQTTPPTLTEQSPTPETFGKEVRRLRNLAALTPMQLAKKVRVSPAVLHKIEFAQRYPKEGVIARLAEALGCAAEPLGRLCQRSKAAAGIEERGELAVSDEAPSDPSLRLGWRISQARLHAGISLAELERRCAFSSGYLRQVERGEIFPVNAKLSLLGEKLALPDDELESLRDQGRAVKSGVRRRVRAMRIAVSVPLHRGLSTTEPC